MIKERIKTAVVIILIFTMAALTYRLWFVSGMLNPATNYFSFSELPFVRFFSGIGKHSVPKENLSKPRKIVINDGSLWIPYYNTDDAYETFAERTEEIVKACLRGEAESEDISYSEWLLNLNAPGIYVEYPITVSPRMFALILGERSQSLPGGINAIKDVIIIPAGDEAVKIAMRDFYTGEAKLLTLESHYAFPEEILRMYAERNPREGYYEFAFSTLLSESGFGAGSVKVNDLVLFSDNYAESPDISVSNPLSRGLYGAVLKSFSFNPQPLRHYGDEWGCENYVENYATVRIYPDGYIEYSAVAPDKGIYITSAEKNEYETLNSAIDFAERVWSSVSEEPLNVLVSGIEQTDGGAKYTLDYYFGGREVAISIGGDGRSEMYHAIEIETVGGRIVSYRQYMRQYSSASTSSKQDSFLSALDFFVENLSDSTGAEIEDIYPGYYDDGSHSLIRTTWLAKVAGMGKKLRS